MQPRLEMLLQVHNELMPAATLPENTRPYSIQARLETIQKQIMEELERSNPYAAKATPTKPDNHDDIPF